jgi:hypothetical protein
MKISPTEASSLAELPDDVVVGAAPDVEVALVAGACDPAGFVVLSSVRWGMA